LLSLPDYEFDCAGAAGLFVADVGASFWLYLTDTALFEIGVTF
jgi:hypothetical protein